MMNSFFNQADPTLQIYRGSVQDFRIDWGARGVSPLSEAAFPPGLSEIPKILDAPVRSGRLTF